MAQIDTTNLDAGTDKIKLARPALLAIAQFVNKLLGYTTDDITTAEKTAARNVLDVPTKGGSGASGTWGISVSGNAATATSANSATTADSATTAGSANSITGTTTAAVPTGAIGSGTANSTSFLRGDRSWGAIPAPGALTTASGSAPSYSARAWVNFNGTGTVAIRASGNVSSITDNGVGDYTVNFTSAMSDANYATVGTASRSAYNAANNPGGFGQRTQPTASSFRVCTSNGSGVNEDSIEVCVSIFR